MKPFADDLFSQLFTRLTATSESWGNRVYKDAVPVDDEANIIRPYVVMNWVGGGDTRWLKEQIISGVVQVVVVADDQAGAYAAWARLLALLQDWKFTTADWQVTAFWAETQIDISYLLGSGTKRVYQAGDRYRVIIQEI